MIVEDDSIEVEKIVSHRFLDGKLDYRIKLKGYDMLEWTPANYFISNKCDFLEKYNKDNNIIFDGINSKVLPKLKNEKIIQNWPSSTTKETLPVAIKKIKVERDIHPMLSQHKSSSNSRSHLSKANLNESSIDSSFYSAESLSENAIDADINGKEAAIKTIYSRKNSNTSENIKIKMTNNKHKNNSMKQIDPKIPKESQSKSDGNSSVSPNTQNYLLKPIYISPTTVSSKVDSTKSSKNKPQGSNEKHVSPRKRSHSLKTSLSYNEDSRSVANAHKDCNNDPVVRKKIKLVSELNNEKPQFSKPDEFSAKLNDKNERIHSTKLSLQKHDCNKRLVKRLNDSTMNPTLMKEKKFPIHSKSMIQNKIKHSSKLPLSKISDVKLVKNEAQSPSVSLNETHGNLHITSRETPMKQTNRQATTQASKPLPLSKSDSIKSINNSKEFPKKVHIQKKHKKNKTQHPEISNPVNDDELEDRDEKPKIRNSTLRFSTEKDVTKPRDLKDVQMKQTTQKEPASPLIISLSESDSVHSSTTKPKVESTIKIFRKKIKHSSKTLSDSGFHDSHTKLISHQNRTQPSVFSLSKIKKIDSSNRKQLECSTKSTAHYNATNKSKIALLDIDVFKSATSKNYDYSLKPIVQNDSKHSSKISHSKVDGTKLIENKIPSLKISLSGNRDTKSVDTNINDISMKENIRKTTVRTSKSNNDGTIKNIIEDVIHSSMKSLSKKYSTKLDKNDIENGPQSVHKKNKIQSSLLSLPETDGIKSAENETQSGKMMPINRIKTLDSKKATVPQKDNTKHESLAMKPLVKKNRTPSSEISFPKSDCEHEDSSLKPITITKRSHRSNVSLRKTHSTESIDTVKQTKTKPLPNESQPANDSGISSNTGNSISNNDIKSVDCPIETSLKEKEPELSKPQLPKTDSIKSIDCETKANSLKSILRSKRTHLPAISTTESHETKSVECKNLTNAMKSIDDICSPEPFISKNQEPKLVDSELCDYILKSVSLTESIFGSKLSLSESDSNRSIDSNSILRSPSPPHKMIRLNKNNNNELTSKDIETPITIDILLPIIATNNKRVFDHILRLYDRAILSQIVKDNPCLLVLAAINESLVIVNTLLDLGANANGTDHAGTTALIAACNTGNETILDLLIKRGADVNIISNGKNKVLEKCILSNNIRLFKRVLSAKADYSSIEHLIEDKTSEMALFLEEHKKRILEPLNIRIRSSHTQFYKNIVERLSLDKVSKIDYFDQTTIPQNLKINRLARRMILCSCDSPKSFTIEQILDGPILYSFEIHVAQNEGQLVADHNGKRLITTLNTMNTYYVNKDEAALWKFSLRPNRDPSTFAFIFAMELYMTDENKTSIIEPPKDYGYLYNPSDEDFNLRRSFIRLPLSLEEIRSKLIFICVDFRETVRWTLTPVQIAILNYEGASLLDTLICPRDRLRKNANAGFGAKDYNLLGTMDEMKAKELIRDITRGKILVSNSVKKIINNLNIDKESMCGVRDLSNAIAIRKTLTEDIDGFMDLRSTAKHFSIDDDFLTPAIVASVMQRIYRIVEESWEDDIVISVEIKNDSCIVDDVSDYNIQGILTDESFECDAGVLNTTIDDFLLDNL